MALLGLGVVLGFTSACGNAADPMEASDEPDAIHQGYEPLNHGPRYFEAPEGPYFDDPGLIVVNPDPMEREPLILSAESYWLADDDVAASTVKANTISFPREGYEHMRGYRPGHVVLSRTAVFRRFIEHVELTETEIIWHTRDAELEEVVIHAEFHFDLLPGTTLPEDFDIVDTYLFPNFEAQRHELYERRLVMHDINRTIQMQQATTCELDTCDIPCDQWQAEATDPTVNSAANCIEWVQNNRQSFEDDPNTPMLCPNGLSDEQCAGVICSDLCELDDGEDELTPPNPADDEEFDTGGEKGLGFTFCLNPYEENEVENAQDPNDVCDIAIEKYDMFTFSGETSGEFGGGNGNYTASWTFALIPRLQISVGMKAGVKIKIWKPGLKAYAGFYAGFGYGATVSLQAEFQLQYNWNKTFEVPIIQNFVVVFVPLSVYAYAKIDVNFRLNLEGEITYNYYRSRANYMCLKICVGSCKLFSLSSSRYKKGEWVDGDDSAQIECSLPHPEELGLNVDVPGKFDAEINAEATLSAGLDIGVGLRIGPDLTVLSDLVDGGSAVGLPEAGQYHIFLQPLELSFQAGIVIAPPLCNYFVGLYLGGSVGAGLNIPIVGWKSFSVRIYGPLTLFRIDDLLDPNNSLGIGCGQFEISEPFEVERVGCSNDAHCLEEAPDGELARCFQRECIKHDNVRVSLGWLAEVDLDLYITKPDDSMVQSRMTQPELFSRQDCGDTCTTDPNGAPYIENFTFPNDVEGEWTAWVVLNEAADNADINEIIYTMEVEFGDGTMRQTVEGSLVREQANQSVFRFSICSPNATTPRCQDQDDLISADDDVLGDDSDEGLDCEPETEAELCESYHQGNACQHYQVTDSCGGLRAVSCDC
ncbi:hypothetical protein DL240_02030 [Lujinxingia litoralis]|uniref:Uncharacterized protein n=1 Tax=Lujinxingia litoralis TaxID=2211119 RepID=A0A328CB01_9DELT|nr:hypothetical protein DL240_02030 [Lujinxingia litoralis]